MNNQNKSNLMRHIKKFKRLGLASIITLAVPLSTVSAQECMNSTGGNHSGTGGSISYTLGQVEYATYNGTTGSLAQGVQQPYEISVVIGLEEAKGISLSISAYPNPTNDFITLSINDNVQTRHALSQLSFQLYDMYGKLLRNGKITGNETSIAMSKLVPATYFVKVVKTSHDLSQQKIKTFKIIKH